MSLPVLAIIVPCYNEEEVLPSSAKVLMNRLTDYIKGEMVSPESYICFINDGSTDRTWEIVNSLIKENPLYRGISLSRNFGHQAALLSGLYTAVADIYISIDADLQDDERVMSDMIKAHLSGADIVYGCRSERTSDTWFKRYTAEMFYKIRCSIGCKTIPNHADYRLMSARVVEKLKQHSEVNLYLRGIIPMLGFPSEKVFYSRKPRQAGESKYPFHKMLKLAWNGVVNFSEVPLHLIIILGFLGLVVCAALLVYVMYSWLCGTTIQGWTSLALVIIFFSSIQLLCTGCIGLYVGKIFNETKRRPLYLIQDDLSAKQR